MADISVEVFLENLKQLLSSNLDFILSEKEQLQSLYDELGWLRDFLIDYTQEKHDDHSMMKEIEMRIKEVVERAENTVDWFVANAFNKKKRRILVEEDGCSLKHSMMKKIKMRIKEVVKRAENTFDWFVAKAFNELDGCSLKLGEVRKQIVTITTELKETYEKNIGVLKGDVKSSSGGGSSSRHSIPKLKGEMVVGFNDEATEIIERLVGAQKQLEIIPIVGAPGGGKTTLAKKVYDDRLIVERFPIRGWVTVSQEYNMEELLIGILESASLIKDEDRGLSFDELGERLLKRLKDKKYLIVLDDVWSIDVFNHIGKSFPKGCSGSRVMLTTRFSEVGRSVAQHPHALLPLSVAYSWELLQRKVFGMPSTCPSELVGIGMEIAEKCRGLPLAIVVVAGILAKTHKTEAEWEHIAKSLSAVIARDHEVYMETVALSYDHLPVHLKPCFLYLGAFPEDYEIPARKLMWLWMAEGFVKQSGEKSVEAIAEEYLMDLVDRSLVMVSQKSSDGRRIKRCVIHDLLRDLCLKKAKDDNFLRHLICWKNSVEPNPILLESVHKSFMTYCESSGGVSEDDEKSRCKHRRLACANDMFPGSILEGIAPNLRTLLCLQDRRLSNSRLACANDMFPSELKLLRVLDLPSSATIREFPSQITELVHLRYVALKGYFEELPPSISNLWNLETLILFPRRRKAWRDVILPTEIRYMKKLRHLVLKGEVMAKSHFLAPETRYMKKLRPLVLKEGMAKYHFVAPCRPPNFSSSWEWDNLQTLDSVCCCTGCLTNLTSTVNLRKLGLKGADSDTYISLPNFLQHLETLKVCNTRIDLSHGIPQSVRKLTLEFTHLEWEEMQIIGKLPHLEVLKLLSRACDGTVWNTNDEEFCELKYLRIEHLDIEEWNACADHFPKLEKLVIRECHRLKEIPSDFAEMCTLQEIEVFNLNNPSLEDSARQVEELFQDYGNPIKISMNFNFY